MMDVNERIKITDGESYINSLSDRNIKVYLLGE